MTKIDKSDISSASLDELLEGISSGPTRAASEVEQWLECAGIYPGDTRARARDLYAEYLAWRTQHGDNTASPLDVRRFGRELSQRYKSGHANYGTFYYISRESEPVIPTSFVAGGAGTEGG